MGLWLKSLLQVKALRLSGKSERLLETFYIACCCTLYIDAKHIKKSTIELNALKEKYLKQWNEER